ncbi:efflux RND transporter periplasmic adaptor subunit [Chitinophagaceae bacterium LB-8]|uniref:Efflux RND transporter periplasmic adaptor subunit n=1 Tax=Paraflavisolibacter caeni TaxID=2982496 RepID=A0A9X2XUJ5_9BACT|nr:efflux RND transporter periplasmic adaptor subunit [Paraflavisolibacter caeni]MCU7548757.1 efflux RND transporter periplasmic adaptor subunit [Paraflavisolibacter caeni]
MQKIFYLLLIATVMASCGNTQKDAKGELNDKKAQLEKLKGQQEGIAKEIAKLEEEIAKADPEAAKVQKAKLVAIATLQPADFSHFIELQGTVDAENIAYVAPRGAGGQVKAIYVKQGQPVRKGQLLMRLENSIANTQVDQIRSQLAYAKDLYQRQQNLWQQGIGTEVQLLTAKNNVVNLEKQLTMAQEQLGFSNVYAEMNGIADQVNIKVGEMFSPQSASMAGIRIVNTSDLKIVTQVPERYLGRVSVGSTLEVTLPETNQTVTSKVTVAGKVIDPSSRTFYIEAKMPAGSNIKPNQIALVKIKDYADASAITVPVNTLQNDQNGKYVMVATKENGKLIARKRQVTIGELYNDQLEVKSGLQAGDTIITDGFQGLYDGQLITTA